MSTIVAIGERERVSGFALAGVQIAPADDPDAVRSAWQALSADAGLVILTRAAHRALSAEGFAHQSGRLWVVMPQ
jgi:vacuolar-type H+-ATPase subunit F/Vma7